MLHTQTHWFWQPALYLFLGGLGAGAFVVATLLYLFGGEKYKKVVTRVIWSAIVFLVVGLIMLITELVTPLRGLLLWQSFSNPSSWMMIGAWLLVLAMVFMGVTAVLMTDRVIKLVFKNKEGIEEKLAKPRKIFMILGAVAAFCVAVYTGILLMVSPGIPFWNTPLLPCLFTVSAMGTGIAFVEIMVHFGGPKDHDEKEKKIHKFLTLGVVGIVVLEAIVLFAYLIMMSMAGTADSTAMAASGSANLLLTGDYAIAFWVLVVGCALVIPAVFGIITLVKKKDMGVVGLIGPAADLIGGCALRFLILMVAMHADPIMDAVAKLL